MNAKLYVLVTVCELPLECNAKLYVLVTVCELPP